MPKHSVVIPSFNSRSTIEAAIFSVMSQTCRDFEVIVVDDCSTDPLWDLYDKFSSLNSFSLHVNSINSGPGPCRNIGIANSCGRYLHFLDSDDIWLPTYLEKIEALHNETLSPFCISSYIRLGVIAGSRSFSSIVVPPSEVTFSAMRVSNHIPILTSSLDTTRLKIPSFTSDLSSNGSRSRPEDYLFWLKLFSLNQGLVAYCHKLPLAIYSVSKASRSSSKYATLIRQYEIKRRGMGFTHLSALRSTVAYAFASMHGKSFYELWLHLTCF